METVRTDAEGVTDSMNDKNDKMRSISKLSPEDAVRRLLLYVGEDTDREGLQETPHRVVSSYSELFAGYHTDPHDILKVFEDDSSDEMVVLRDIEFYSMCEHHILPFFGKAHVAYIPDGRVVGISKLARAVDLYARRLQIQERLCQQVTSLLDEVLKPKGSACLLEAQHLCMLSRGVGKQNSVMISSSLTGAFQTEEATRNEFLSLVRK
jgi:GTP cyclohydrolase IA